jgi:glycosyltransferase involved in cell wall biosynthesis
MNDLQNLKVAVIHDWLVNYSGAEKVLEQILLCFPNADLFSVVDFVPEHERKFLGGRKPKTTFIQNLPFAKSRYRAYLPLMPLAIEQLDVTGYDLVLSSSHAVSKGVLTGPNQLHVSYVHSPIRYAWELQHQYLRESDLNSGFKAWMAKFILHYIRMWDTRTANGVDHFIANSRFIGKRIEKVYRRPSQVVYPPVATGKFQLGAEKGDFYLTASRMVPYKLVPLIVEAFGEMPDKKLVVIGDGPDLDKARAVAKGNVQILGYQSFEVLHDHMQRAKAFVFAAEEDFGIAPVEAQACGTPVIAFGRGGALETVISEKAGPGLATGLFFQEQSKASIQDAVKRFEAQSHLFSPQTCREHALRFSEDRFRDELKAAVSEQLLHR